LKDIDNATIITIVFMHVFPYCVKFGDQKNQNTTTLYDKVGKNLIKSYIKESQELHKSCSEIYFSLRLCLNEEASSDASSATAEEVHIDGAGAEKVLFSTITAEEGKTTEEKESLKEEYYKNKIDELLKTKMEVVSVKLG
jgi:hypothetical protein